MNTYGELQYKASVSMYVNFYMQTGNTAPKQPFGFMCGVAYISFTCRNKV